MNVKRITELPNPNTLDLDLMDPESIIRTLRNVECEMYSGYKDYTSLMDRDTVKTIVDVQRLARSADLIVMSGCGTSGRLAHFAWYCAKRAGINSEYLIAGGDSALVTAQEGAEDDPDLGISDLVKISEGYSKVLYIGITCGLSANYVLGQLHHCVSHPERFDPVLIGFNPVELARDIPVRFSAGEMSFRSFLRDHLDAVTVLNPILGPEPITGSTRMKGGSATRILLDLILSQTETVYEDILRYRRTFDEVFYHWGNETIPSLARCIDSCSKSLFNKGRVIYLSEGNSELGITCFIDASECRPTFGCLDEDVRAFIGAGMDSVLENREGDIGYRVALSDYEEREFDTVICLGKVGSVARSSDVKNSTWVLIDMDGEKDAAEGFDIVISLSEALSDSGDLSVGNGAFNIRNYVLKSILNSITTGTFVLYGAVFKNRMINLRISNQKLYVRTLGILSEILGHFGVVVDDKKTLEYQLIRVIYDVEEMDDILKIYHKENYIQEIVELAYQMELVVPCTLLLLADPKLSVKEAKEIVFGSTERLRNRIKKFFAKE